MSGMWNKMNELNGTPERRQHKSDPFTGRCTSPLAPFNQLPGQVAGTYLGPDNERQDRRVAAAQLGTDTISGRRIA